MLPLIIAGAAALGGAVVKGVTGANAARQLQAGQANARRDIEQYTGKAAGYQQPYYDMGTRNATTLSNMTNTGQFNVGPYNYQDQQQQPGAYQNQAFNFQADPGYQWQMQQGMDAIQGQAAAGGGLLSGGTLKAMQKYGQGLANQTYNQAFQRNQQMNQTGLAQNQNAFSQYGANREFGANNAWNQYQSQNQQANQGFQRFNTLASMGQAAGNNLSTIYGQAGANVANTDIGQANAGATGTMAVGSAVGEGLNALGQMGIAAYGGGMGAGAQQTPQQVAQTRFNQNYGNLNF